MLRTGLAQPRSSIVAVLLALGIAVGSQGTTGARDPRYNMTHILSHNVLGLLIVFPNVEWEWLLTPAASATLGIHTILGTPGGVRLGCRRYFPAAVPSGMYVGTGVSWSAVGTEAMFVSPRLELGYSNWFFGCLGRFRLSPGIELAYNYPLFGSDFTGIWWLGNFVPGKGLTLGLSLSIGSGW